MQTPRRRVYVIGAGFSAGLGYPLMNDILTRLWDYIDDTEFKRRMVRVIRFYYPNLRGTDFPNVEELLSRMVVNEQLLDSSRQYEGEFTKEELSNLQHVLLLKISEWFHDILKRANPSRTGFGWLYDFRDRVVREDAVVYLFQLGSRPRPAPSWTQSERTQLWAIADSIRRTGPAQAAWLAQLV